MTDDRGGDFGYLLVLREILAGSPSGVAEYLEVLSTVAPGYLEYYVGHGLQ